MVPGDEPGTTAMWAQSRRTRSKAAAAAKPTSCITMNIGTDSGAMPANESLKARAMDTAGFANDVEDVNQ